MTATATPDRTVTGVDFVLVPVQDLDRARKFYGEVLGLQQGRVWQGGDGPAMGAEFETGTVTIALMDPTRVGHKFQPGGGAIALRVDDVATRQAELEAKGVEFVTAFDSGVCWQAIFSDTEGNSLILHHRYAPNSG